MEKGYGRLRAEDQNKENGLHEVQCRWELDGNSDINIQGDNLERVNTFKYLGATLA